MLRALFLAAFVLCAAPASAQTLVNGVQINRVWPNTNNGGQSGLPIIGGTVSGSNLFANRSITGTNLFAVRIAGGGLTDCDASGTSKLLWDAATKQFACGTDQNTQWSGTGALQTAFDSRYVNASGDTMTGALKVRSTISGSALRIDGLGGCDTIDTNAQGVLSCGTDADTNTQFSGTGALQTAFDARYVNTSGDSMTGTLAIRMTTPTSVGLNVIGTMSGRSLLVAGTGASTAPLLFTNVSTGRVGLGTVTPISHFDLWDSDRNMFLGNTASAAPGLRLWGSFEGADSALIQVGNSASDTDGELRFARFGTLNTNFDILSFYVDDTNFGGNVGVGKATPRTALEVAGSMSGSILVVSRNSFFSGSGITFSTTGSVVFNEGSRNVDFRIEGDADASLFYLDASADRIGVGTATPNATLAVFGTISGTTITTSNAIGTAYGGTNLKVLPTRSVVLTAGGGLPALLTGSGASSPERYTAPTNASEMYVLEYGNFAKARYAMWTVTMPDNYDGGTIAFTFNWKTAGTAGDVKWYIQCRSLGDAEAIDQSWGTAVGVTDTAGTANTLRTSSATAAVTCAGTPAGGEVIQFRVYRDAADAADTLADTGALISVKGEFLTNSYSD